MEGLNRPATWLDMAGVSQWHPKGAKVRIHPVVGPEGECYALTLDRRWLCGNDGSVTLFHGLGAAVRFLRVAQVNDFEAGDAAELADCLKAGVKCLSVRRGRGLQPCASKGPGCPRRDDESKTRT